MQITSHAILKLPLLFSSTERVVPELLETWLPFSPLGISQTKNINILWSLLYVIFFYNPMSHSLQPLILLVASLVFS